MARPVVLLTGKEYYQSGWIEEHWPLLLECCDVRLTDERSGPALEALLAMPNVIGTPHGLSHAEESFRRCADLAQQAILSLIEGRLPEYTVNRSAQWRALQEAAIPST